LRKRFFPLSSQSIEVGKIKEGKLTKEETDIPGLFLLKIEMKFMRKELTFSCNGLIVILDFSRQSSLKES
jgi:hypothetical protein